MAEQKKRNGTTQRRRSDAVRDQKRTNAGNVRADGAREHGVQTGRMFAKSADGSGKRELGS